VAVSLKSIKISEALRDKLYKISENTGIPITQQLEFAINKKYRKREKYPKRRKSRL
jgi:hypothetical protein